MSINNFFLKKILKSKLRGVPEAEQDKIITLIENNPDLFQKIAKEAQEKINAGQDQNSAMLEVMQKYQDELKGLM